MAAGGRVRSYHIDLMIDGRTRTDPPTIMIIIKLILGDGSQSHGRIAFSRAASATACMHLRPSVSDASIHPLAALHQIDVRPNNHSFVRPLQWRFPLPTHQCNASNGRSREVPSRHCCMSASACSRRSIHFLVRTRVKQLSFLSLTRCLI